MKRKYLLLITVITLLVFVLAGCGDNKKQETETTTEATTELTTIATTAEATSTTDEETAEIITDTPETTKEKPQSTQTKTTQPKPAENNDVEFEDKPAGSGGIDWSGWDPDAKPDTNHVGGETPEENEQMVQDVIDENGWDMDWELN